MTPADMSSKLRGMGLTEIRGCVPCKAHALPSLVEAILTRHGDHVRSMNVSSLEPGVYAVSYCVVRS